MGELTAHATAVDLYGISVRAADRVLELVEAFETANLYRRGLPHRFCPAWNLALMAFPVTANATKASKASGIDTVKQPAVPSRRLMR